MGEYTPVPTALGATVEIAQDGEEPTGAILGGEVEPAYDAIALLERDALHSGAPGGSSGTNARTLSFQQGALYGLRHRATWIIADATPGTGSLDSGGSTATPTEPAFDEYLITGDLTGANELHLQLNIVTANNANQTGRRIRIVRRTSEVGANLGEDVGELGHAFIVIEYLTNGASPVEVATFQLQPSDELIELGAGVGVCWGWLELTFVPTNLSWRCTAWGGAGRPVYS
jgi:hypothetical protein